MGSLAAVETSTLVLLSLISLMLCAYLFLVCWRFYLSNGRDTDFQTQCQRRSADWLHMERKPLLPGNFTARTIQPSPPESDSEEYSEEVVIPSDSEERGSLGRIIFVLRYSGDREELMVRLIQIEGIPSTHEFYNLDTAYVDVHLEYVGPTEQQEKYSNPPKLDLCLQQVYYFIISHSQLLLHSLVFRVNTFDNEYRRTVCGEVRVHLIEELKQNMFTGKELFLIKEITSVSKGICVHDQVTEAMKSGEEEEEVNEGDRIGTQSPASSHMSWEPEYLHDELTDIETVPSSDTTSRSGDSVPWKRFRKRKRRGGGSPLPDNFGSVASMPSAFKFPPDRKRFPGPEVQTVAELPNFSAFSKSKKLSVSDTYMPRYSSLDPPPEDFYHLLPETPLTAKDLVSEKLPRHASPLKRNRWTSLRRKCRRILSDSQPSFMGGGDLKRSNSWPSHFPQYSCRSQRDSVQCFH